MVARLCVIRGTRYHDGSAAEFRGMSPEFARALNGRSIMSGSVHERQVADESAYCIWYIDVASEEAYPRLAQTYPEMKYQIDRACAVAGYSSLLSELDLLSDLHTTAEARDNGNSAMFETIMSAPRGTWPWTTTNARLT